MKLITYITAVLLLLSVPAFAAGSEQDRAPTPQSEPDILVTLMSDVTVNAGVVRLGDLFNGAGNHADRVVAYAPRPGERAVFDARWLGRVAKIYKLNWQPGSTAERAIVERASQILTKSDIEALLQQRYLEDGGEPSSVASVSNRTMTLHLPLGDADAMAPNLDVEQMSVESDTGRFSAVVSWGTGSDERVRVAGRIERMAQVPVLSNRVARGEVIDESNVVWQSIAETRLPRAAIIEADQIVGMAAKRTLGPGAPIAATDVRRPLMVNRGETVTMTLTTPFMQLSTKGRALQNGSEGDTIRISNLQTSTVIDAVVTGPGQARVETAVNLAMR